MLLMSQTINGLEIARYALIFLLHSRSCYKSEEICSGVLAKDTVSRAGNSSVGMKLTLPQEKVKQLRLK